MEERLRELMEKSGILAILGTMDKSEALEIMEMAIEDIRIEALTGCVEDRTKDNCSMTTTE